MRTVALFALMVLATPVWPLVIFLVPFMGGGRDRRIAVSSGYYSAYWKKAGKDSPEYVEGFK